MAPARSPYMEWAKKRPRARVDLAGSNLTACRLEDLPGAREELDLGGESPDGYAPLIAAIAARYGVEPENVATAAGCSGANFLACAALLDPGDEALLERPIYDPLVAAVRMVGARPRFFERRFEDGFALDAGEISRQLTPATRLVIVSSPHNPSGVLASEATMREIARVAEKAGVPVLVDEVYLDTIFDRAPPAAMQSPLLLSSNSLTKSYGLSALRCGWTLASPEMTERIRRARDVVDVSGPIPAERLALAAFRALDSLSLRARRIIEPNRSLLRASLSSWDLLESAPFHATIAFPRFRDGRDAGPFAARLFERHGVAVVPGTFFGLPSHFRISIGGPPDVIREGVGAIGRCLHEE